MLYSVLIYDSEPHLESLSEEADHKILEGHVAFQNKTREAGQLGPVARLMSTAASVTLRPDQSLHFEKTNQEKPAMVLDGPFAETKEQLVGFYILEAESLDVAIELVRDLPLTTGCHEIRPIQWFDPGVLNKADAS